MKNWEFQFFYLTFKPDRLIQVQLELSNVVVSQNSKKYCLKNEDCGNAKIICPKQRKQSTVLNGDAEEVKKINL